MENKSDKNFVAACEALKIDTTIPDMSMFPEMFRKPVLSFYKLIVIIKAKKAGRKFNWKKYGHDKFSPWFTISDSGFQFHDFVDVFGSSRVGSRLSSFSHSEAKSIAEQNLDLYSDILLDPDDLGQ